MGLWRKEWYKERSDYHVEMVSYFCVEWKFQIYRLIAFFLLGFVCVLLGCIYRERQIEIEWSTLWLIQIRSKGLKVSQKNRMLVASYTKYTILLESSLWWLLLLDSYPSSSFFFFCCSATCYGIYTRALPASYFLPMTSLSAAAVVVVARFAGQMESKISYIIWLLPYSG